MCQGDTLPRILRAVCITLACVSAVAYIVLGPVLQLTSIAHLVCAFPPFFIFLWVLWSRWSERPSVTYVRRTLVTLLLFAVSDVASILCESLASGLLVQLLVELSVRALALVALLSTVLSVAGQCDMACCKKTSIVVIGTALSAPVWMLTLYCTHLQASASWPLAIMYNVYFTGVCFTFAQVVLYRLRVGYERHSANMIFVGMVWFVFATLMQAIATSNLVAPHLFDGFGMVLYWIALVFVGMAALLKRTDIYFDVTVFDQPIHF